MKNLLLPAPLLRALLGAAVLTCVSLAQAAADDPIVISLTVRRIVESGGKEKLEAAEKAKPGDVLLYSADCRNRSKATVRNVKPVIPIPTGLEFLPGSTEPAEAEASTDGTAFATMPLMHDVKQADGTTKGVAVPAAGYRAVRWSISEIPAGKTVTVQLRARVTSHR